MIKSLLDIYPFPLKDIFGAFEFPPLQSHRGYRETGATENTLLALQEARRVGYQMAEFDLRLSADSVPVLHHDATLQRICGDSRGVHEVESAELQSLGVTLLSEVLIDGRVPQFMNIEFKNPSLTDFRLEKETLALIRKHSAQERCMFSSFNPMSCLYTSQNQIPGPMKIRSAFLVCEIEDPDNPFWGQLALAMPFAQPHLLHLGHHQLSAERMDEFRRKNWTVNVWTVNEIEKARQLLNWGASSIITDSILPDQL